MCVWQPEKRISAGAYRLRPYRRVRIIIRQELYSPFFIIHSRENHLLSRWSKRALAESDLHSIILIYLNIMPEKIVN